LFDSRTSDPVGLARLASALPTDVVVFDRDSEQAVQLNTVLTRWRGESIADEILRLGQLVLPDELMTIVRRALRLASQPFGLHELAAAALMPERSLRHYCATRGFLTPQRIIGWTRLMHCAFLLEDEGRTIESIADVLGFPSPTALRNQLREYTGCTASQLRARGAFHTVARSFEAAMLRHALQA
jgi:transcriptional regulator GlxA family with amidase domain